MPGQQADCSAAAWRGELGEAHQLANGPWSPRAPICGAQRRQAEQGDRRSTWSSSAPRLLFHLEVLCHWDSLQLLSNRQVSRYSYSGPSLLQWDSFVNEYSNCAYSALYLGK